MTIAIGTTVMAQGDEMKGENVEMVASRIPVRKMEAYERVLGDAMAGDSTLFAREDYVEEAWRIVDPALKADTPVYPNTTRARGGPARSTRGFAPGRLAQPGRLRKGRFPRCRTSRPISET
jgi:glucose-6-phosphate 1-dehydrogenase